MPANPITGYLPPPFVWWIVGGLLITIAGIYLLRQTKRGITALTRTVQASETPGADILTYIAASIATVVSAQGMWQFIARILGDVHWSLRGLMFAFLEVAVITSAVRARRNVRDNYTAGIDGVAVRAFTCLSAVLSAMEAASIPEAIFRLAAPLVAAWLWERGMAIERRRITGRARINWRLTPERVLVRVGLAEASDRTAGEVDAQRHINRVALAVMKARDLRELDASDRKQRRARTTQRRALAKAVEHAALAADPARQRSMLDQIGALCSSEELLELRHVAPWKELDHPAITGPQPTETAQLVAETQQLTETIRDRHDRDAAAAVKSLAAYAQRRHVDAPGWDRTPPDATGQQRTLVNGRGQIFTDLDSSGRDQPATTTTDHKRPVAEVDATATTETTATTPALDATTDRPELISSIGRADDASTTTPAARPPFPSLHLLPAGRRPPHHPATSKRPRPASDRDQNADATTDGDHTAATGRDHTATAYPHPPPKIGRLLSFLVDDQQATDQRPVDDQAPDATTPEPRPATSDRKRTKDDVIRHVVATIAETGHAPTKRGLKRWSGWGDTWCRDRINEATVQLVASGWTQDATGYWARPGAADATGRINGSVVAS